MLKKLNWPLRSAVAFLALVVLTVSAFAWGGLQSSPVYAKPNVTTRLQHLNILRDMSLMTWSHEYDNLRLSPTYRWMDWSQDECSSPSPGSLWNDDFLYGCLRNDFMWRTLAVADEATGKIWNERNRWVADNTLYQDLRVRCAGMALPHYQGSTWITRTFCYEAAW